RPRSTWRSGWCGGPRRSTNHRGTETQRNPVGLLCVSVPLWLGVLLQEVPAQLADGLVLLVADALDGQVQLLADLLRRPALEAELQDALLPWGEQFGRGAADDLAVLVEPAGGGLTVVGGGLDCTGVAAGPLGPLLDRVDGAEELPALLALGAEGLGP